jgi:hypothetical protein
MKYTHYLLFFILPIIFGLAGCGDDSAEVSLSYSYNDTELHQFDVIDSYGTNSEFDSTYNLAISPYINSGAFDLFWDIRTDYDYIFDFRINTTPTLAGSQLVFSENGGRGHALYIDRRVERRTSERRTRTRTLH